MASHPHSECVVDKKLTFATPRVLIGQVALLFT
jgi:hypothetical protein